MLNDDNLPLHPPALFPAPELPRDLPPDLIDLSPAATASPPIPGPAIDVGSERVAEGAIFVPAQDSPWWLNPQTPESPASEATPRLEIDAGPVHEPTEGEQTAALAQGLWLAGQAFAIHAPHPHDEDDDEDEDEATLEGDDEDDGCGTN